MKRKREDESLFSTGEQLSEYEKKRLENIRKNQEVLLSLNFEQTTQELKVLEKSKRKKSSVITFTPRTKAKVKLEPTRRSLRIRGKMAEEILSTSVPTSSTPEPRNERKPPGPITIVPLTDIEVEESKKFLNNLAKGNLQLQEDDVCNESLMEMSSSVKSYQKRMSKLHVLPNNVAKMVPHRIFSMAFHPSSTKSIICAGDKWGHIGFWDVDSNRQRDNGIFVYDPHSSPVTSLSFHPERDNNLFSTSYDGTVRCADFNTCVFDEVYTSQDYIGILGLSYPCSSKDILVLALGDGQVAVVDTRTKTKTSSPLYHCHNRAVKSIHCSPTNENLFCTSSGDALLALWDIRKMKNIKSNVDSVRFGHSVTSAYFSPQSGQHILTTSLDHDVKVFEVTSSQDLVCRRCFKHNNHAGRWLTPFRATWDPKNDRGIAIGSMLKGRRVDIYHSEQTDRSPLVELFDDNYGTITSINVFHDTRNVLACGNSSGKVYIWTER